MTYTHEEYMRLPGPTRFTREVVEDFEAGKSVVIVFPDAVVDSGLADAVLGDVTSSFPQRLYCRVSDEPFPARILGTFHADGVRDRNFYEWDSFIHWKPWHGQGVTVPGWEHSDIATILQRWPAQLVACGLPNPIRPKLVIGVRLSDIARPEIMRLDRMSMTVRWWWGVLDRLDTETRLASIVSAGDLNLVEASVVSEISGWDLDCADFLVSCWDKTTLAITDAVDAYRNSVSAKVEPIDIAEPVRGSAGPHAPSIELEQLWNSGRIEWWGHSLRRGPSYLTSAQIRQRVWLAHNRTLIAHVDDERARFENQVRDLIPEHLQDRYIRNDDIIEIGPLKRLVDQRVVVMDIEQRTRLQIFWRLRNDLAHRNPIDDILLQRVLGYLRL